jgi:hypothetical protein
MMFDALDDYIKAFAKNRELAIIPIPLVADHLGKSGPAVSAMLRDERLEEIKIGKNRFVGLKSLVDMQDQFDKQVDVVERDLVKQAKKGVEAVYYEPVMAQVGMNTHIPADRNKIGIILGEISERSQAEKGVMLSVLVHRKTLGTTNPGPGFYGLARNLGYDCEDNDSDFVRKQTARVLKAYREQ